MADELDQHTTRTHTTRDREVGDPAGGGPGRGTMAIVAIVLLLVVGLLLFLYLGGDDDAADDSGVDVTQEQEVDVDEDQTADDARDTDANDTDASGGDDVIVIERSGGDGGSDTVEGGDVIAQESRADGPTRVQVSVDDPEDFERFDGATFRVPAGVGFEFEVENDTDRTYNAYLSPQAGGELTPDVGTIEPLVEANSTRQFSVDTVALPGTYDVRVEDEDGNTVFEGAVTVAE